MISKHQASIDELWQKYAKALELLNDTLDELAKKPKEVVVEKEVERIVEADIDLSTPDSVAELERLVEQKLQDGRQE